MCTYNIYPGHNESCYRQNPLSWDDNGGPFGTDDLVVGDPMDTACEPKYLWAMFSDHSTKECIPVMLRYQTDAEAWDTWNGTIAVSLLLNNPLNINPMQTISGWDVMPPVNTIIRSRYHENDKWSQQTAFGCVTSVNNEKGTMDVRFDIDFGDGAESKGEQKDIPIWWITARHGQYDTNNNQTDNANVTKMCEKGCG